MAAWKKAITEDDITWMPVMNDPAVNNLVSKYGISAYPPKILEDRGILWREVVETARSLMRS